MTHKRIRGSTPQLRAQARQKRGMGRLKDMTIGRIKTATGPAQRLSYACDYLRAVAARFGPETQSELARKVAELADKALKKREEETNL